MTHTAAYDEKRRYLKQRLLSRAISEGRGNEAISKLNALYRNLQATLQGSDDDIIGNLSEQLTEGRTRATLHDLQEAAFSGISKYVRAFNMQQVLLGSSHRLSDAYIHPAHPTLQ